MTETFSLQAGALRRALDLVLPACRARGAIPILSHVHMQQRGGRLALRGTNMDIEITTEIEGDGNLPAITAPAHQLHHLAARIAPEETVALSTESTGQLRLATTGLTARLCTLPAEDLPPAMPAPSGSTLTLQAAAILRLMRPTLPTVSTEETRYYLNGLFVCRHEDAVRFVGTDGHRILYAAEPWPAEAGEGLPHAIIPRAACAMLMDRLRRLQPEAAISMTFDEKLPRMAVAGRDWCLTAKLIDGTFPDYIRVIPQEDGAPIAVHQPKQLARWVETISGISTERSCPVRFGNGSGNTLTIATRATELGDAEATIPTDIAAWATDQAHPEFGLQARYVLDLCRALPSGFTLRVQDGCGPIHVSGADATGAIMPIRI